LSLVVPEFIILKIEEENQMSFLKRLFSKKKDDETEKFKATEENQNRFVIPKTDKTVNVKDESASKIESTIEKNVSSSSYLYVGGFSRTLLEEVRNVYKPSKSYSRNVFNQIKKHLKTTDPLIINRTNVLDHLKNGLDPNFVECGGFPIFMIVADKDAFEVLKFFENETSNYSYFFKFTINTQADKGESVLLVKDGRKLIVPNDRFGELFHEMSIKDIYLMQSLGIDFNNVPGDYIFNLIVDRDEKRDFLTEIGYDYSKMNPGEGALPRNNLYLFHWDSTMGKEIAFLASKREVNFQGELYIKLTWEGEADFLALYWFTFMHNILALNGAFGKIKFEESVKKFIFFVDTFNDRFSINDTNSLGQNVYFSLQKLSAEKQLATVKMLLDLKVDPFQKDNEGISFYDIVVEKQAKYKKTLDLLKLSEFYREEYDDLSNQSKPIVKKKANANSIENENQIKSKQKRKVDNNLQNLNTGSDHLTEELKQVNDTLQQLIKKIQAEQLKEELEGNFASDDNTESGWSEFDEDFESDDDLDDEEDDYETEMKELAKQVKKGLKVLKVEGFNVSEFEAEFEKWSDDYSMLSRLADNIDGCILVYIDSDRRNKLVIALGLPEETSGKPVNFGKRWTEFDEKRVESAVKSGYSICDTANLVGRDILGTLMRIDQNRYLPHKKISDLFMIFNFYKKYPDEYNEIYRKATRKTK
jgi:hypothetical protein